MKNISIGYSPCPNDTFIFDALVHNKIDTGGIQFNPLLADVEQLNTLALQSKLDVTKVSLGAYAHIASEYVILDSGSALGKGVGPVLVSKNKIHPSQYESIKVGIPGRNTTANLLLSILHPEIKNKTEILFSNIENAVLSGEVDAGLLIHEGRFTYKSLGLEKVFDLGELWESKMTVPLPLGCIAIKRTFSQNDRHIISSLIRKSINFANTFPLECKGYVQQHAQEMDEDVIRQHISLYVNDFSITLGPKGREAITLLLANGNAAGLLPKITQSIFNTNSI